MLEYIILGIIILHEQATGYEIRQYMALSTQNFFFASFGSIYPALERMVKRGLAIFAESHEGKKFKKIYRITKEGEAFFYDWLGSCPDKSAKMNEMLVRIFFFRLLPENEVEKQIDYFIVSNEQQLDHLEAIEKEIETQADFFQLSTKNFGKEYYRFLIGWLTDYKKQARLQGGKK